MTQEPTSWKKYEDVARKVISDLRHELEVADVEAKQELTGASGATWEIDGRAACEGGEGFLVVEARRHTTSGQKQEHLAALAYRIHDLGGAGGIIVSPLPLQSGARIVAEHEKIVEVTLAADSTSENYMATFLKKTFHHATVGSGLAMGDRLTAHIYRPNDTPADPE